MQLQGVTQLPFYMVLRKLKFLKVSQWKRKTQASKTQLVFHAKFQKQELKMLNRLFKLVATLQKKERV